MAATKTAPGLTGIAQKCLRDFEADETAHNPWCAEVEKNYRAYRGIIELRSEAADWTHKLHPPYAGQITEMIVASMMDPSPKWRLRAQPRIATIEEIEQLRQGARANELLLSHQLTADHFPEKQRPMDLQGIIAGLTVSKQHWLFREGTYRTLVDVGEEILPGVHIPHLVEATRHGSLEDDPTCEPVDVRDFIPQQGAISLQKCLRVTHRVWLGYDELMDKLEAGTYGPKAGGATAAEIKRAVKESRDSTAGLSQREQDLFQVDRTKEKVEVLECWIERGKRVVSIANRNVLLEDRENPYWFERLDYMFPFVVCSAMPDLFRIPGISDIEWIRDLQECLWSLMNQRLDNLELLNNAIVVIRGDLEGDFEWYPGAQWFVDGDVKSAAAVLEVPSTPAQISLQAESLIKGDLQDITGGFPFIAGSQSGTVANDTATGASIFTSIAQRRVAARKQQFTWARRRIGEQWCAMNQQFIREARQVPFVGEQGIQDFFDIQPEILKGDYSFETEMVDESTVKAEKRAAETSLFQVFLNAIPAFAALKQANPQAPLPDMKALGDRVFDAFDIDDKERYWTTSPAPQAQLQNPSQPPGMPAGPDPNGVAQTAPQASDMSSPSNAFSQSPVAAQSRLGAMAGGVNNA